MISFDVDDMDDYDHQFAGPPCPWLGHPAESPDEEYPEDEDFISATVSAVLMRELSRLGVADVFELFVDTGYDLFVCESGPDGPVPFLALEATWRAWEEMLDLILEGAPFVWIPPMEAPPLQRARQELPLLREEVDRALPEPSRGVALASLRRVEVLVDQMTAYRRDIRDSAEWTEAERDVYLNALREWSNEAGMRLDSLAELLQASGEAALAERVEDSAVSELARAHAFRFYRYSFPAASDSMHWDGLSADEQIRVVLKLDQESLMPTSFVAAELITQLPGTHATTSAALARTGLWDELVAMQTA